jgi:branched-chain amino acid transport system substrate-binding protein
MGLRGKGTEVPGREPEALPCASMSRRDFLKAAGIAGAAVGVGAGLGGLLAACGGETTTSAAGVTTTAGATSTEATTATTAGTTTSASASAEMGREVKIGLVFPETGALAAFGIADNWFTKVVKTVVGDGMVLGDSKKHLITVLARDCQSDSNRSAQVAGDLIQNDKVDILLGSVTPDITNSAADQAEAMQTPFLSTACPWNAFVFGRGADLKTPFKWTYGCLMGSEQMMYSLVATFDQIPNNKKVAFITANSADGNAWLDEKTGAPVALKKYGYELAFTSRYTVGAEDYTGDISKFRKAGCDVLTGAMITPDFINLWKQCLQQGFNPKVPSIGLAIAIPEAQKGLGASGVNLLTEQGWNSSYPFTDPLTGWTCQQMAEEYEKDTGFQRTNALGNITKFAMAFDALKRAKDVDNKETIIDAIKTMKMETALGPIDFTKPVDADPAAVDSYRPHPNVCKPVYTGGQWQKDPEGKWPAVEVVVSNPCAPQVKVNPVVQYVYS